jgi:cytochrome c-type biogenesis protein
MIEATNVGVVTAFAAGLISFASPCVLPLVPGYISYVAGRSFDELQAPDRRTRLAVLGQAIWFVFGFSTVFLAFGASATYLGRLLLAYRQEANNVGGLIVILLGLFMTGGFKLRWLQLD